MFKLREIELLNILKVIYLSGKQDFLSVNDIESECEKEKLLINNRLREQLTKLYAFGYLDCERNGFRGLKYRIKPIFVFNDIKEVKNPLSKDLSNKEYRELYD